MSLSNFHPGEVAHCYLTSCVTSGGTAVTPTPLVFTYWPANATGATVATTSGSVITIDTTGTFHAAVTPTTSQVGIWHYRWSSTGDYKLSQWGAFRVLEPPRST